MDTLLEKDFVFSNLIAYIGNKRRLIPLIAKAISEIKKNGSQTINENGYFIDYFSGSGVVAKFAKSLGFNVIANDLEYYSYILNKIFIEKDASFLENFEKDGRLDSVLDILNGLTEYHAKNAYISKYYCPKDDENPNVENERMFFTKENGIIIDNIRSEIDDLLKKRIINKDESFYLLALLVYKASTHSNTSGVFKAFHKGFGGKNKDALNRICKKIELQKVPLSRNKISGKVYQENALVLVQKLKKIQAEIVYLDPPYNQHQYGSNYHLLNTIAKNDKPKISETFIIDGKKQNKSAIRSDWKKTRSTFCYRDTAIKDFSYLIKNINAKYILISYSTEGLIPFDTLLEILSEKGKIGIVTSTYTRYRGGRQANTTKKDNIEFVLMIDTASKTSSSDLKNIQNILLENLLSNLSQQTVPFKDEELKYDKKNKLISFELESEEFHFELTSKATINMNNTNLNDVSFEKKKNVYSFLNKKLDLNVNERIENILFFLDSDDDFYDRKGLTMEVLNLFKKINPHKTPDIYENTRNLMAHMKELDRTLDLEKNLN